MTLSTNTQTIHHTPIAARPPVLKVVGVGGGGCNAVNRMIELGIGGVDFIVANTDAQALSACLAPVKLQLGPHCTRGLGAGGQPEIGQLAAEESLRTIGDALSGADMVFIACGMGGGTGTGAAPVIARIARNMGAVTVAIVTMPFNFEAGRRQANARQGLDKIRPYTDTLISIPNDKLMEVAPRDLSLDSASAWRMTCCAKASRAFRNL
jgi:cell division protein FtsZ